MLEDSLIESRDRAKTRKPLTVVVSAMAHVVTIVLLVLIPLLQTQALTVPPVDLSMWIPKIEPLRPIEVFSVEPRVRPYTRPDPSVLTQPESIPAEIAYVEEPPRPNSGFVPSMGSNRIGALIVDLISHQPDVAPPMPPPPPALPPPPPAAKADP